MLNATLAQNATPQTAAALSVRAGKRSEELKPKTYWYNRIKRKDEIKSSNNLASGAVAVIQVKLGIWQENEDDSVNNGAFNQESRVKQSNSHCQKPWYDKNTI